MRPIDAHTYGTCDWSEVIWLLANRQQVVRTVREGDRQVRFCFSDPEECKTLLRTLTFSTDDRVRAHREALEAIRVARAMIRGTP